MAQKRQLSMLCLLYAPLLFSGCGGGAPSAGLSGTPTPTPSPTPNPTPTNTVVCKTSISAEQPPNILGLNLVGANVFGVGVVTHPGVDQSAYAAVVTDNGATAAAGPTNSLPESGDMNGAAIVNSTTALAVGRDTPAGSTTSTAALFTLNPGNAGFLTQKPIQCPSFGNTVDATAIALDGSTAYVALAVKGADPVIVKADTAGNVSCTQTPIDVPQGNTNGVVHKILVTADSLFVGGEFLSPGGVLQGFVVRLDKATGNQIWAPVFGGRPVASIAFDAAGALYVGETKLDVQPHSWFIEKFTPPFTVTSTASWSKQGIAPAAATTQNTLIGIFVRQDGNIVAAGFVTPAGTDTAAVQTAFAVLDPATGATSASSALTIFPGDREHMGSAFLSGNNQIGRAHV